ncbi:MAG TPA: hypothetical protein VIF15_05845 [Polyangiaceae bacterium]
MRAPLSNVLAVACAALAWAGCSSSSSPAAPGDGGPADAGVDAPLNCPPVDLGAWQPPAYHHAEPPAPNACATALIDDYYASCLGPNASQSACDQSWNASTQDTAHLVCQTCLVTLSSAAAWGPLVSYGSTGGDGGSGAAVVSLNVAGCIELLDPGQLSCATQVQDVDECEHQACDAACPVTSDATFGYWKACTTAAGRGECSSYVSGASCQSAFVDAGAAAPCVSGATFQDAFIAIATVFCGH